MSPRECEGDPGWWDSQATTMEQAKWAVWSIDDPHQWEAMTTECVDHIVRRLELPESNAEPRLLDVGVGMGRLAVPMILRTGGRVVGMDVSTVMLAQARQYARDRLGEAIDQRLELVETSGRDCPPGPFDGAYTVVVLQHNPPDLCADLVRRVGDQLAPGARFVFQVVGNEAFTDPGHIAASMACEWAEHGGLLVEAIDRGPVFRDWLWVTASKVAR